MSEEPPHWLSAALAAQPPRRLALRRPQPAVGQIWLAAPDAGPRVALLLVRDSGQRIWQALLCSTDTDLASDSDSILTPALTGASYALLVHGDLTVPVPERRLWRSVGALDRALTRKVTARGWDLEYGHDLGRGTPIRCERDIRCALKCSELERLRTVAASPREAGLD